MWLESALGLCVGCKIYGVLARRGWIAVGPDGESCASGYCEPRGGQRSSSAGSHRPAPPDGRSELVVVAPPSTDTTSPVM